MQVPLIDFCISVVLHASQPYSKINSTLAVKNWRFKPLLMSYFHTFVMLLSAFQASAFHTLRSVREFSTHEPRYLKSFIHSISVSSAVCNGACSSMLNARAFVFLALAVKSLDLLLIYYRNVNIFHQIPQEIVDVWCWQLFQ